MTSRRASRNAPPPTGRGAPDPARRALARRHAGPARRPGRRRLPGSRRRPGVARAPAVLRDAAEGLPVHRMPLLDEDPPESIEEGRLLRSYRLVAVSAVFWRRCVTPCGARVRSTACRGPTTRSLSRRRPYAVNPVRCLSPTSSWSEKASPRVLAREGSRARPARASQHDRRAAQRVAGGRGGRCVGVACQAAALPLYTAGLPPRRPSSPTLPRSATRTSSRLAGVSLRLHLLRAAPRTLRPVRGVRRRDVLAAVRRRAASGWSAAAPTIRVWRPAESLSARGIGVTTSSLRVGALTERRVRLLAAAGARQPPSVWTVCPPRCAGRSRNRCRLRIVALAEAAHAAGIESPLGVMFGLRARRLTRSTNPRRWSSG